MGREVVVVVTNVSFFFFFLVSTTFFNNFGTFLIGNLFILVDFTLSSILIGFILFIDVYSGLFTNDCCTGEKLFAHITSKEVVYYLGKNSITFHSNSMLTLDDKSLQIYNKSKYKVSILYISVYNV